MRIIGSIETTLVALASFALIVFAQVSQAEAESVLLTGGDWILTSFCEGKYKCSTVKVASGSEVARIEFPYAPVSAKETGGVIEVLYSCGAECSATYFILANNYLSGPYSLVESVDYKKGTLLSVGSREFSVFKFTPEIKDAIKVVKVDMPSGTTLPSRVISSKLVNNTYFVDFKGEGDRRIRISIEQ